MQLEPLYLQGRTSKSWGGYDTQADDKGRKAGEGALAASRCTNLRLSQVGFLGAPKGRSLFFFSHFTHCRKSYLRAT